MRLNLHPTPRSALAIGAHPDDIEFQCGATLARWAHDGCVVHLLVLTDGSKGTWDPEADPVALAATRRSEQLDAAAALGVSGAIRFGGQVDGELRETDELRAEVARTIRELRPEILLGHDPWKRYRLHPDHRHAGWLTVDAAVAARDPHFFPDQGLAPHRPKHLLLFEPDEADLVVDVCDHVEDKLAALYAHRSQLRSTMKIDDDGDEAQRRAFEDRVIAQLDRHGALAGIPLGEAYHLLDL